MSIWPRVFRAVTDFAPLGIRAGDHVWYDLTSPEPIRIVRTLPYDHGLMLQAEMDGAIEPCAGAVLPSHGLTSPNPRPSPSAEPDLGSIRLVR